MGVRPVALGPRGGGRCRGGEVGSQKWGQCWRRRWWGSGGLGYQGREV